MMLKYRNRLQRIEGCNNISHGALPPGCKCLADPWIPMRSRERKAGSQSPAEGGKKWLPTIMMCEGVQGDLVARTKSLFSKGQCPNYQTSRLSLEVRLSTGRQWLRHTVSTSGLYGLFDWLARSHPSSKTILLPYFVPVNGTTRSCLVFPTL